MGWDQTFPASRPGSEARPARWRRGAPIRQACGRQGRRMLNLKYYLKAWIDAWPRLTWVQKPVGDGGVGIDSAVAEEGPVAADFFEGFQVDVAHQDFFAEIGRASCRERV